MKDKRKRVPVQVHTRKIDRLVAKHQMKRVYTRVCESAKDTFGKPEHNRYHSKKGANHVSKPDRNRQSYFAAHWKRFIPA